jgi:hypothetical protein
MNTTTTNISSAAMLVDMSFSVWTGRKTDKAAGEELSISKHADRDAASVSKNLLKGSQELQALQKFVANARNTHYAATLPWADTGIRLLPTAKYFDYHAMMTSLQNEFYKLVEDFLCGYDWEVANIHMKLGDLFNRDEYPSADKLRGKFAMRFSYIPLPDAGDFRVDIGNQQASELRSQYEDFYTRKLNEAMGDIWQKTYTALSRMSERLDYDEDSKKKFHGTLVTNVLDMVDLLETANITNDPAMQAMARKLKTTLQGVTAEGLRINTTTRLRVKAEVDQAIAEIPSMDW